MHISLLSNIHLHVLLYLPCQGLHSLLDVPVNKLLVIVHLNTWDDLCIFINYNYSEKIGTSNRIALFYVNN